MKNFLTSMLGALAALVIFAGGAFLVFVAILGAIISLGARRSAPASGALESGSYLVFNLSTNITDAPPPFDFSALYAAADSDRQPTLQLRPLVRALREATDDPRIAGILLQGSLRPSAYGSGYAALREVRAGLAAFRKSGKPIRAYLEAPSLRDYYLASVANEIDFDPFGTIFLPGLSAESIYFAGALEKYGVGIQVTRVGKYKSAVEALTRKDMSPEDRQQLQELLDEMSQSLLAEIGRSRGLTPAAFQATADAQGLIGAEAAKQAHLVDRVMYRDQLLDELKAATGRTGSREPFKQVALSTYLTMKPDTATASAGRVAVVYAEGEIVDGDGTPGEVGGAKYAAELRKLRQDGAVKAIVLRVNSPGGSVTASEEIQREIVLARKVKPVIVSMGAYAASGGYWISADSDRIFAEPTTITGSIGVFGIQFDVQKLAADFGVTFDGVKTGKFAGSDTITRPKTDQEMAIVQHQVDWFYGQFIDKVAAGRKLPRARVEEIAQGRVWSGEAAKRLGLVDQLGGLRDAIIYAGHQAGLSGTGFSLVEYPARKSFSQALAELLGHLPSNGARAPATGLLGEITRRVESELSLLSAFNDPQGLYARLPLDLEIK
jgi:protease-4